MGRRAAAASALLLCLAAGSTGCDKLKTALGKGDAGESGATSGGLLSFLGTDFEGEITANVTTKGAAPQGTPQQMVFGIHKPKYRIDTNGVAPGMAAAGAPAGAVLFDLTTKKGYVLMAPQKMAMVLDFEKMKSMPKGSPVPGLPGNHGAANAPPAQPPKVEKTGKKDSVAGYSCELWNITSEGHKAEACVAEGITWIDLGDLGMTSPAVGLAAVATEANRFPLRVVSYDAKGAEEMRMEVVKVDKKKLDDARFVVPPDYRVVDMAQMMTGLGNLPAIPTHAVPTHAAPKR